MRMKCLRIFPDTMPRISWSELSSRSLNIALGNAVVTVASTSIGSDLAISSPQTRPPRDARTVVREALANSHGTRGSPKRSSYEYRPHRTRSAARAFASSHPAKPSGRRPTVSPTLRCPACQPRPHVKITLMLRWIFSLLVAASFFLCGVIAAFWIRSYFARDELNLMQGGVQQQISSDFGRLQYSHYAFNPDPGRDHRWR